MKFYYDLHVHSTLSPCGDEDNTPNNICGMASLCDLKILALTDHNTAKNCPAFFHAARKYDIIPIAGMELTTSEDVHVVCLFENLDDALSFDKFVEENRMKIKNRPEIFGNQTIMNENDEPIGEVSDLLINASYISCDEVSSIVSSFGGICYPAHIDREANGIVATLGVFPEFPYFPCAEIHDSEKIGEYKERFPIVSEKPVVVSSDAHYLWDISGRLNCFELDVDDETPENIRKKLFERLKNI